MQNVPARDQPNCPPSPAHPSAHRHCLANGESAQLVLPAALADECRGRSGAQILDLTAAPTWQVAETLAGSPPVKLVTATLTLPLKASVPQCGQPSATVATPTPRPSIVMEVLLFGGWCKEFEFDPSL